VQWNVPNPPFPGGSDSFFASAEGNRLPHTPDWTANLGATYVLPTPIGEWTAAANYFHSSGWYGEPDNQLRQPAYNMINASLYWRLSSHYSLGLWGRNLSNELVYSALAGNAVTSLSQYSPPRTYGIKFSAEF
jgi:iron complex outermembrane receptor protein